MFYMDTDMAIGSAIARNVRIQLSLKIRGRVKTTYDRNQDKLIVDIFTDELECWRYVIYDVYDSNSTDITFEVMTNYKRDIMNKFFR